VGKLVGRSGEREEDQLCGVKGGANTGLSRGRGKGGGGGGKHSPRILILILIIRRKGSFRPLTWVRKT